MPVGAVLKAQRAKPPKAPDQNRQVIVEYLADFSREFGDRADLRVTIARVMNSFRAAGVPLGTFTSLLYEARSQTKASYAGLRDKGKKMAYFLSCFETLLGLRELPESPEQHRNRTMLQRSSGRGPFEGDSPVVQGSGPSWEAGKQRSGRRTSPVPPSAQRRWVQTYDPEEGLSARLEVPAVYRNDEGEHDG